MKDLIIDTFLAAKKTLLAPKKYNCFEFFGYDFLIDEDLRVWLIEVNKNSSKLKINIFNYITGKHKSLYWNTQ